MQQSSGVDFPTERIHEGSGEFVVPRLEAFVKSASEYAPSKAPVFYNPVMELNRDIAVLALRAYAKMVGREIIACEPFASVGIRGVRFASEVKGVAEVVMNDINEKAVHIARHNALINGVKHKISVKNMDANLLLSAHASPRMRFDAIDVDPFGSPAPYVDSAVRALRDGGLLALTATDMAPLCGVHPKACVRKYGGKPLRTEYCHELAVRLLIGSLAVASARHEIGITPVFSHKSNHYVRVYSLIKHGAKKADESLRQMGHVLHCFKCFHREKVVGRSIFGHSTECSECGAKLSIAGPLWIGRIFDPPFCGLMKEEISEKSSKQEEKIRRMLQLIEQQAENVVGYYVIDRVCDVLNLPVPSVKNVIVELQKKGFKATQTLFNPKGIRSDASAGQIKKAVTGILNRN